MTTEPGKQAQPEGADASLLRRVAALESQVAELTAALDQERCAHAATMAATEPLRRTRAVLESVVEGSTDAIFVKDLDGRYGLINQVAATWMGADSAAALLGRDDFDVFPEAEASNSMVADRKAREGSFSLEETVTLPDGTVSVFLTTKGPVRDEEGNVIGTFGIARNITERKRSEERLRLSEAALKEAGRMAKVGYWQWDIDSDTLTWSDEVYRMFGMDPARDEPPTFDGVAGSVVPEERQRFLADIATALERGSFEGAYTAVMPNGQLRQRRTSAEVGRDPLGRAVSMFGIVQDVTEQLHKEEELRAANARLVEADRRKGEYLAMLSHELRNPLAPIRTSLYVLERATPGGPKARRAQEIIGRQVEHLSRLVDDLLEVNRLTRGRVELRREWFDMNDLVQRTTEDHESLFAEQGIRLEVNVAPSKLLVHGDWTRLTQGLGKLLQNAAKFTPTGGRVTVSVRMDGGEALVIVEDTGPGVAPDLLPMLFDSFVQADTTLDRRQGGLGLGLALVKGLVELHGGTVTAESAGAGRGATFSIRLPIDDVQSPVSGLLATPVEATSRRVLVIEDNLDAAESLKEVLELCGHVVAVAHDGRAGLAAAHVFHPEVVLCDIGLPELDGYAVARALRAERGTFEGLRLIALTGYARPEDVAEAQAAGFDVHLAKPPSLESLEHALVDVFAEGRAG